MKKNKKIIASVITGLALAANLVFPAATLAYSFSMPGKDGGTVSLKLSDMITEGAASVESRYGFSKDALKTAERKVTAPRVEISFDNTNPKVGEKVTAHALPEFFKNDTKNLYYTWYLIRTEDGKTSTLEEGKKEAAKIMARGDYDPDLDGQAYSDSGKDPDSDGWPAIDGSYDEDTSAAPMGGADGVGGLQEDGGNIEEYSSAAGYCDSKGTLSCNYNTDKSSFGSYYAFSSSQTGDFCQYCQKNATFSATPSSNNQCCYLVQYPEDTEYASYDSATSYCPTSYSATYESCFDYSTLKSTNESTASTCLNNQYRSCKNDWDSLHGSTADNKCCYLIQNPSDTSLESYTSSTQYCPGSTNTTYSSCYTNANNLTQGSSDESYSRCYKHNFGTNSSATGYRGYSGSSESYGSDDSGLDYNVTCEHKWKDATGYTSGSGEFPTGEEEYWKTDPTDPDTDGDGFVDEADVIGLGQIDFTWTYKSGDRVGVVVEGTSMIPTDEKNAYYKIMWGYPDVCDSTKTGLMDEDECDDSDDYGYGFLATKAPNESGEEKLKVSLSSSPDDPVADPSDDNSDNIDSNGNISDADQVTVVSSIDNTDSNPKNLYYTWQISKGDPATDVWKEVDIQDNFSTSNSSSGTGISQFSFTPKKSALSGSDDIIYFKVTLTVSQTSTATAGRGRSSVVVPVNKNGIKISLYKVDVSGGKATIGDEVCDEGLYVSLCPALKGQMLAAKVSGKKYTSTDYDFAWDVNGNTLSAPTDSDASDLFDGWNSTSAFFPITKQEQQIETLSVTATPKDTLQPVTGTRLVTVVEPAVFIKSADTSLVWPITRTVASSTVKDESTTVESSTMFRALTSSTASFYLDFVPYYLLGDDSNTQIDWQINGESLSNEDFYTNNPDLESLTLEDSDRTINIPTSDTEGTSYDLTAEIKKYWSSDEANILSSAWGVTPTALDGSGSIAFSTTATASSATSEIGLGNPGQILAAIGTHLPHYFMYLLRLVLTMAVMFVVSAALYGLSRRTGLSDET